MREAFALQKLLTFCQQKFWRISDINVGNFNEMLTNDVVRFEQPGPKVFCLQRHWKMTNHGIRRMPTVATRSLYTDVRVTSL